MGGQGGGEIYLHRRGCRRLRLRRGQNARDLNYGEVVGHGFDGFHECGGGAFAGVVFGGESDFSALEICDFDETGGAGGGAGGLVDGGGKGGAVGDEVELLRVEVVEEDVEGEDVFDGAEGEVLREEIVHGGVVDGADGDCLAAVDLRRQLRYGKVVVEGGKLGVFSENTGDVESIGGGGEEEKGER